MAFEPGKASRAELHKLTYSFITGCGSPSSRMSPCTTMCASIASIFACRRQ